MPGPLLFVYFMVHTNGVMHILYVHMYICKYVHIPINSFIMLQDFHHHKVRKRTSIRVEQCRTSGKK
jgi:hypothetical protein